MIRSPPRRHAFDVGVCWSGCLGVAEFRVDEGGADPFARNDKGGTCARFVALAVRLDMCVFLYELGCMGILSARSQKTTPEKCLWIVPMLMDVRLS
ncbi:hypothetical protein ACHAWF_017214 [Thalassiosira exigua]